MCECYFSCCVRNEEMHLNFEEESSLKTKFIWIRIALENLKSKFQKNNSDLLCLFMIRIVSHNWNIAWHAKHPGVKILRPKMLPTSGCFKENHFLDHWSRKNEWNACYVFHLCIGCCRVRAWREWDQWSRKWFSLLFSYAAWSVLHFEK